MTATLIETSIRIQASTQAVWAAMHDPLRRPQWDALARSYQPRSMRLQGCNTRFRLGYALFGLSSWLDLEYVTWQPGVRSAVSAREVGRISPIAWLSETAHLQANADGSTTVAMTVDVQARGGLLLPLLDRLVRRRVKRLVEQSQQALKQQVEAEPTELPMPMALPLAA